MFKEFNSRLVPNQFLIPEEIQYARSYKIKGNIKQKRHPNAQVVANKISKIESWQNTIKPRHLDIIDCDSEEDAEMKDRYRGKEVFKPLDVNNRLIKEPAPMKNARKEFNSTTNSSENSSNKENASIHSYSSRKENQVRQNIIPERIQQNEFQQVKEQNKVPLFDKKISQKKKKIFNLDLSSSNSSENQQQKNESKQQTESNKDQSSEKGQIDPIDNIFQFKATNLKRNISKFNVSLSQDSSQQVVKQAIITHRQPQKSPKDKKFIMKSFDSDSQDEQNEVNLSKEGGNEEEEEDQFQVMRNMNFLQLKTHFLFDQRNKNWMAFNPIPTESKISLIVKRNSSKSQYSVYDNDLVLLIMKVQKTIGGTYKFMMAKDDKFSEETKQIGKMKANFMGTQFHCYTNKEENENKKEKYQCFSIKYDMNILGLNGPRKVKIYGTKKPIPSEDNLLEIYQKNQKTEKGKSVNESVGIKFYQSKNPKWMSDMNAYVLNLRGTANHSSIKNCIIVDAQNEQKEHLLFGKKAKDIFNLIIKHPMTILQGVAFAVSSFERKLGCQ